MLTPASLETAACLWEAVLEMESYPFEGIAPDAMDERESLASAITEARDQIGSSGLRLTVIGWTEACDAAWHAIDDPTGNCPGQYGESFDWDFVPQWIRDNVDWSDPQNPTVRK